MSSLCSDQVKTGASRPWPGLSSWCSSLSCSDLAPGYADAAVFSAPACKIGAKTLLCFDQMPADVEPADYFAERGFDLTFDTDADGIVWASLVPRNNPSFVVRQYGRGTDQSSAASRAMRRWRQEQGD